MKRRIGLLGAILMFSIGHKADASSFPSDPGATFVYPGVSFYSSSTYLDAAGAQHASPCTFVKRETTLYGEYGVSKGDTATVALAYDSLGCGDQATAGLADVELGWNHQLHRTGAGQWAGRAVVALPTGYNPAANPRIGFGRSGFELAALYGASGKHGDFFDGSLGVRTYGGTPATQVRAAGTAGFMALPGLQILGSLDFVGPLSSAGAVGDPANNPEVQERYHALQGTMSGTVRIGPAARLYIGTTALLSGANTGRGRSIYGGLWTTF